MNEYKSPQEDLQNFFTLVFGEKQDSAAKAEQIKSGIYKAGSALGLAVIALAFLMLNHTS